jgi:uncharacterized membrane protein YbaN (DUF454 family)
LRKIIRILLIIAGTISVALGIIGIFLPLLPTTPFLLLAATCYAHSSKRFLKWLLTNRWFGNYIKNYREGKGIRFKIKVIVLTLMWLTTLSSAVFFIPIWYVKILLVLIAGVVTWHIAKVPTLK